MSSKEALAIAGLVLSSFIPMYNPGRGEVLSADLNIHGKEIPKVSVVNSAIIPEETEIEKLKRLKIKPNSPSLPKNPLNHQS